MNHNLRVKGEARGLSPKFILAFLLLVVIASLVFLFSRGFLGQFQEGEKKRFVQSALPELNEAPKKQLPGLKDGTTFLLIGSDKRWGSTEEWGRSDTILLAKISRQERAVSLLSLPRDLLVPIPGYGEDKINAAYSYGGPGLLIATVREYLGVPINHFFQVSFDGFAEIVRGFPNKSVYIPVDGRYYHSNEGLSAGEQYSEIDLRPGYQALGAEDALAFVRFRHLDSDFYRAARQQLFLREVARQVYAQSNGNLSSIQKFARSVAEAGASDFSSITEALSLANTIRGIPPSRVLRLTLSGSSGIGSSGAYYIDPSQEEIESTLRLWNNPSLVLDKQKRSAPLDKISQAKLDYLESITLLAGSLGDKSLLRTSSLLLNESREKFIRKKSRIQKKEEVNASLVEQDTGEVSSWLRSTDLKTCTPSELPAGYSWGEEPYHKYRLSGYPALALYASKASGASILWMWSNWGNAPILDNPDDALRIGKKQYFLFWESGNLRMISWNLGKTRVWISNTLRNELSAEEMIALAESCR